MTAGITKTNRFPTLMQECQRSDWRLVLQKPTAVQPSYIISYGWNDGWFCENQPRSDLGILNSVVGMMVAFTETNRFTTLFYYSLWLDWLLVLRKPNIFQPSYRTADDWIDGWFCKNHPCSNHRLYFMEVGTWLVIPKPTFNPPIDGPMWGLENGWFSWKQPSFQPCALRYEGWNGVDFRKTKRQSTGFVVLYEGWNTVAFVSIFCTNQLVRIGLVDSWTSPRGRNSSQASKLERDSKRKSFICSSNLKN